VIIGTGIDIVEVDRIQRKLEKDDAFKRKIFSSTEIEYCDRMTNPFQHYAARFAGKEAFLKATGLGMTLTFDLFEIEITHAVNGNPVLQLKGELQRIAIERGWNKIHLSLSHVQTMACAVVILETE
jgi:holo-[acyl-carrier protein] synthase